MCWIVKVLLLSLQPGLPLLRLNPWLRSRVEHFTERLRASAESLFQVKLPFNPTFGPHGWNDIRRGDRMEVGFVHREEKQQASLQSLLGVLGSIVWDRESVFAWEGFPEQIPARVVRVHLTRPLQPEASATKTIAEELAEFARHGAHQTQGERVNFSDVLNQLLLF